MERLLLLSLLIACPATALLTEFHKWASAMEKKRMRSHAAAIRALDLGTEALSDRVRKLGPRGNVPARCGGGFANSGGYYLPPVSWFGKAG
jgi:hypothetical protein